MSVPSRTDGSSTPPFPQPRVPQLSAKAAPIFCYSVLAGAEPGVMPRVLELFAKRNLVPKRWHSDLIGPQDDELAIDLQVVGLTADRADYIARCLREIYGVERVLLSEKQPA